MRTLRRLIWIPHALAAALTTASAPSQAQIIIEPAPGPAPYYYYGPAPYSGPGQCYYDSLNGRVCVD